MLEEKKYADKEKLLTEIRQGNRLVMRAIYEDYRGMFERWARKHYQCDDDLIVEAYQQAFIAFYSNVKEGRLSKLDASIKTYLFAIGKNTLRSLLKDKHRKMIPLENHHDELVDTSILDSYHDEYTKQLINNLLTQIGEPCKTVLELYYMKNYTMESIAHHMGYKTEQIAAKRKFICLRQLKELMIELQSNQ